MKKNPRSLKTRTNKFKTNRFTLLQERIGRWKVSGRDSEGNYRRIRFDAPDLSEAIKQAEFLLSASAIPTPVEPVPAPTEPEAAEDPIKLQISDALFRSCADRIWTEYNRRMELSYCDYFLRWIDELGLTHWNELRYEHVLKYQKSLVDRGLAYDTIRLYLLPVRRAAKWVASNWPRQYVNICQNLRLSRRSNQPMEYDEEAGNPYLSIPQVLDFLHWLSMNPRNHPLIVGVAMQGLAGLQMKEALRLTWEKVNWCDETITIDGEVKNRYRIRRIPVSGIVMWILKKYSEPRGRFGFVIKEYVDHKNYSHAVAKNLKRWDASSQISPKDLRNTLQTAAIDGGWYSYYVQRYVGHAPQTIGERHYHGDKGKRLIPLFRQQVVDHIEEEVRRWKAPMNTPIRPMTDQEISDKIARRLHDPCNACNFEEGSQSPNSSKINSRREGLEPPTA
ncbi:MAG: tyrosine-type recombinase/integrase [bacterium]|nr:tyrosine-type recombinase/integrase [bacterium]